MLVLAPPPASRRAKLASQVRVCRKDGNAEPQKWPSSVCGKRISSKRMKGAAVMQRHQLTGLISMSWPLDCHIDKDGEMERGAARCFRRTRACLDGYYETKSVFQDSVCKAFDIWIPSEARKAVILVHWCSHPPPRINSEEVLAHWCSAASLIRLAVSATTIPSHPNEISAPRNRLDSGCKSKRTLGHTHAERKGRVYFRAKEGGRILFSSHFLPKNTLPWK